MKKSHRKAVLGLTLAIAVVCLLIPGTAPTAYLKYGVPGDSATMQGNNSEQYASTPFRGPEAEPFGLMIFGLGLLGFSLGFNKNYERKISKCRP